MSNTIEPIVDKMIKCPECDSIHISKSQVAIVISSQLQDGDWHFEEEYDYENSDGDNINPSYTCSDCENEF